MTVLGPNQPLAGRYHLLECLDTGTFGELWRARDDKLMRPVALKLIRPEFALNPAFRQVFGEEARAWAAVSHPGTAWVYDFGEQPPAEPDGTPIVYLVTELVEGVSLQVLLDQEPLSPMVTMDLVAQAASTLHAAHQGGLVHGNVKPSNLLLRADGVLKITDFGMARAFGEVPLAEFHADLDRAAFCAPEQLAGLPVTSASDIYSLGTVAYLCLSGALPFASEGPVAAAVEHLTEQPRPLPDSVPADVAIFVYGLLTKDLATRPGDAAAVAAEAVALCTRLGRRTTRPRRELLGGESTGPALLGGDTARLVS
jgi:serine/threonine protein kinase